MYGNHANRNISKPIVCGVNWDSSTNGEAICQPLHSMISSVSVFVSSFIQNFQTLWNYFSYDLDIFQIQRVKFQCFFGTNLGPILILEESIYAMLLQLISLTLPCGGVCFWIQSPVYGPYMALLCHSGRVKPEPKPKTNICTAPKDLPTGVFTTLDDQQMPSVDDYLIDPEYPV